MPNTFPTNRVAAGAAPAAATGGDFLGVYPTLTASPNYVGAANGISPNTLNNITGNLIEGFIGDGDSIVLPTSATAAMTYFDNTGTQVTTGSWAGGIVPGDFAFTTWLGFTLDATDNLLYIMTTSGTTIRISSIDAAGVKTTIGTEDPGAFTSPPSWNTPVNSGASNMWRAEDGSGDFTLRTAAATGTEEASFSSSTGAVTQTVTKITTNIAATYKTPKGNYAGLFANTAATDKLAINFFGTLPVRIRLNNELGMGKLETGLGLFPMQWKGLIVLGAETPTVVQGTRAFEVAVFDKWVDDMCVALGISV